MSKHATDVVAYIPWLGPAAAWLLGAREASLFHINQALVLALFSILSVIPVVGWLWGVWVAVYWCMGLSGAVGGREKPVPLLGGVHLLTESV